MQPIDIQIIGTAVAVKWTDDSESFVSLEFLRRHCPCAGCQGEKDIMGNVYKNSPKPLDAQAFELQGLHRVGGYALRPVWADGHNTGLFSYDYLKRLSCAEEQGDTRLDEFR